MASESTLAAGFPADTFRAQIAQVMLMGMPENEEDRLTFYWNDIETFTPTTDDDDPLDWTATPVTDVPGNSDITEGFYRPNYALEFAARPAGSVNEVTGEIDTTRLLITLLDVDFDKISTADYAKIKDVRYRIQFAAPEVALFPVGVHTLYLEAEDQA